MCNEWWYVAYNIMEMQVPVFVIGEIEKPASQDMLSLRAFLFEKKTVNSSVEMRWAFIQ